MNDKTIIIPIWAIELVSVEGYVRRFLFHVAESKTYKAAYLKTEEEYFKYFGVNRYSSYYSFATARRMYKIRQLKKKKKLAEQNKNKNE